MPDYGLTDDGYTAPRAADHLAIIRDAYEASTGLTIDWAADTFLGNVTTIMADRLGDLSEASQALYDAFDVNAATGLQLDNLALIVGVTREPATYSTATVTLTGTVGTIIPEGRLVEGGGVDGHARWALTEDATIGGGGTVAVIVQAEEAGVIEANPTDIATIVTPVDGWTAVSNAAVATAGTARETDAELRRRRQQSLQTAGSRSLNALRANVLEVDGVQAAVVIENDTGATATIEGVSLTAHSVGIIVYPSTLTTDQKQALVDVIYGHVSEGIATNGTSIIGTVTDVAGFAQTIRAIYATTQAVAVAVVVVLAPGYELADVEAPLEEAIADYFLALDVGDAARRLQLYALAAAVEGVLSVTTLTLDAGAVDIDPSATVLLTLGSAAVTE